MTRMNESVLPILTTTCWNVLTQEEQSSSVGVSNIILRQLALVKQRGDTRPRYTGRDGHSGKIYRDKRVQINEWESLCGEGGKALTDTM